MKYPPAKQTWVFEYANVDLRQLRDILFSEYLTLAVSGFEGPYENPEWSRRYAADMGADVFIVSTQFKETRTSMVPLTLPTTSTTSYSGTVGTQSFYGTATSYGTSTTMIPVTVERYNQSGIYLRNLKNVKPLWLKARSDLAPTETSALDGTWRNETYRLLVYRSGQDMVGVIQEVLDSTLRDEWHRDDMKFLFGVESGKGIYLMGNRTPMPVSVSVNQFGYLEVMLLLAGEKFSFARE